MSEWGESHQRLSKDRIRSIMRVHQGIWQRVVDAVTTPPDLFLDIGPGTVGSEAWEAAKDWFNTRIIGFEPCVDRFKILQAGGYPGDLSNVAVSEIDGEIPILMGDEYYQSILAPPIDADEMQFYEDRMIQSVTLDTVVAAIGQHETVFIWADIEGAELRMLKGAKRLLFSGQVVGLNLEVREKRPAEGWCTAGEVAEFLAGYGFDVVQKGQDWLFLPKSRS